MRLRASTLKSFLAIHSWVGLASGLFLFIAFYCGAFSVFRHELHHWQHSETRHEKPQTLAHTQQLLDRFIQQHPKALANIFLQLPSEAHPQALLYWSEPAPEGAEVTQRVSTLKGSGELVDHVASSSLADFIYTLHFTGGIPAPWGTYLFGIACILYALALISGVVLFLPVLAVDLFALRLGRNLKRLWQDVHNVIGTLSLPFHLIFAWTGAVLAIGTLLLAPFQFLVFENKLLEILSPDFEIAPHPVRGGESARPLPLNDLLARVRVATPELRVESLMFHDLDDANGLVEAYGSWTGKSLLHRGGVALKSTTGEWVRQLVPGDITPGRAFYDSLVALHYGSFDGALLKWLYFVLALAGAFLFYSGNLLWIESRRKRQQPQQPGNTLWVARLTVGVCLGCMVGVSALFLANKLLPSPLAERALWEERVYFILFFLSCLWALLRHPTQAAQELLLLCAALTAAIPVVNALTTGDHLIATAARGDWSLFAVDALGFVGAGVFWRIAKATGQRGQHGHPHSIWALPARQTPPLKRKIADVG